MGVQTIDFSDLEVCDFNGQEVLTLVLNGNVIWEAPTGDWVDGDDRFYYTGVDANGVLEDELGYNGNPVKYYLGKRQISYKIVPLSTPPSTSEDYVGKYVKISGINTEITSSNITTYVDNGTIIVGETTAYEKINNPTNIDGIVTKSDAVYTEPSLNALRPAYYNGYFKDYEFFPEMGGSTGLSHQQDVPTGQVWTIPNRYNRKPITKVMKNAFKNGTYNSAYGASSNQLNSVGGFIISEGIEEFGDFVFEYIFADIKFPESTKIIGDGSCENGKSVEIPVGVQKILGNISYQSATSTYNCIYRASNATLTGSAIFSYFKNVVFESTVTKLSGDLFGTSGLPTAIVFKHPADANITLSITAPKSAITVTMYTDNTIVKNYDWAGKNYTVTFKSLSEWSG